MAGASVRITDNRKLEQHILAQLKRLRSSVVTVGVPAVPGVVGGVALVSVDGALSQPL